MSGYIDLNKLSLTAVSAISRKKNCVLFSSSNLQADKNATKLRVLMVTWDLQDRRVYTSASDFSIRVWDPTSGKHMGAFKGHQDEAYVIQPHPFNPRVLLSGSHDGYLIIWDCYTFQPIKKFYNQVTNDNFLASWWCHFS